MIKYLNNAIIWYNDKQCFSFHKTFDFFLIRTIPKPALRNCHHNFLTMFPWCNCSKGEKKADLFLQQAKERTFFDES